MAEAALAVDETGNPVVGEDAADPGLVGFQAAGHHGDLPGTQAVVPAEAPDPLRHRLHFPAGIGGGHQGHGLAGGRRRAAGVPGPEHPLLHPGQGGAVLEPRRRPVAVQHLHLADGGAGPLRQSHQAVIGFVGLAEQVGFIGREAQAAPAVQAQRHRHLGRRPQQRLQEGELGRGEPGKPVHPDQGAPQRRDGRHPPGGSAQTPVRIVETLQQQGFIAGQHGDQVGQAGGQAGVGVLQFPGGPVQVGRLDALVPQLADGPAQPVQEAGPAGAGAEDLQPVLAAGQRQAQQQALAQFRGHGPGGPARLLQDPLLQAPERRHLGPGGGGHGAPRPQPAQQRPLHLVRGLLRDQEDQGRPLFPLPLEPVHDLLQAGVGLAGPGPSQQQAKPHGIPPRRRTAGAAAAASASATTAPGMKGVCPVNSCQRASSGGPTAVPTENQA